MASDALEPLHQPGAVSADQSAADWKALHELSTALLKPDRLENKLLKVLKTVATFHGATQGVISIHEPLTNTLLIKASLGLSPSVVELINGMKPGCGVCGNAFVERRQVVVEDFLNDPAYHEFHAAARVEGLGAIYSTPFYDSDHEALGVLTIYFRQRHRPTEREMRLADICAGTVALFLDRDRSEEAVRRERDRRDQVLTGMAEGLCVVDHQFNVIEMNAAAVCMNKRPAWEMLGQNHWALWPDTEHTEVGRLYRKAMAERVPVHLETRWVDPSGRVGWFELSAQPIDEGLALYIRDITERKLAEEAVVQSEARYRALTESLSEVLWRCDAAGLVVHALPSWETYSGQTRQQYDGQGWREAIHPDDRNAALAAWNHSQASGARYEASYRLRRRDGQYRLMAAHGVALRNAAGEVSEWIGNCEDITEAVQAGEQLRLANRRKDEFLAILSHEMRNPLAAAKMAAMLLEAPNMNDARAAHLGQVINRQVGHMSRLVEDLIDVSRVSQGLVTLDMKRVDMMLVLHEALEQVRPMMTAKRHTVRIDSAAGGSFVSGDKTRLVQVVSNLLSNAARYTPDEGSISIRTTSQAGVFVLEVADNGIGLDAQTVPELFNLFVQAERSTDRKNGGLGLGLALVKSLVELHGGSVTASSDGKDLGSMFAISLPCISRGAVMP